VCEPCYDDGQHLRVEAKPSTGPARDVTVSTDGLMDTMQAFGRSYDRAVEEWRQRLLTLRAEGKRVAIWGAGGRGISFLNTVCSEPADSLEQVAFAVDINPTRQGRFLPRTGQEIVAPTALLNNPVDVLIITNPTYEPEIRREVQELGLECDFYVV
jgi:C-methyltransferase C-terminal domain